MSAPQTLDPIATATAILAVVLSPELAHVLGAYAAIFICAGTGASWALGRKPTMRRRCAVLTWLRFLATSAVLTSSVEELLVWLGALPPGVVWPFSLIAFALAAVGDDWVEIAKSSLLMARDVVLRRSSEPRGAEPEGAEK